MGNQENIPGECVSGFIPVTDAMKVKIYVDFQKSEKSSWRRLTEGDIFVQRGLEVPSKTMKHRVTSDGESEALVSVVVHV